MTKTFQIIEALKNLRQSVLICVKEKYDKQTQFVLFALCALCGKKRKNMAPFWQSVAHFWTTLAMFGTSLASFWITFEPQNLRKTAFLLQKTPKTAY